MSVTVAVHELVPEIRIEAGEQATLIDESLVVAVNPVLPVPPTCVASPL